MSVISGINGKVDGKSTVRDWSITERADDNPYTASNTDGAPGRVSGNYDWTGRYSAYGHTPEVMPGDTFSFVGCIDSSAGTVKGCSGNARVETAEITIDIEGGKPIAHTIDFAANGALTKGTVAAADSTMPNPPPSVGCKMQLGTMVAAPVFTELPDVRVMRIRFTKANPTYASSSTSGVIQRVEGNLDVTVSVDIYTNDFNGSPIPAINEFRALRCFVNTTEYWQMYYAILQEISNMEVKIEDASPVGCTLNFGFTGFALVDAAQTKGTILKPGGAVYWS